MKEVNREREERMAGEAPPGREATSGVRLSQCEREPGRWLKMGQETLKETR